MNENNNDNGYNDKIELVGNDFCFNTFLLTRPDLLRREMNGWLHT